jgi:hypothetical protein
MFTSAARRFAIRGLLFLAPFLLIIFTFEWMLWRTGETLPVTAVLSRQEREPKTLWLRSLIGQSFYAYKWEGIRKTRPRVLALGSSRVTRFRAPMFGPESGAFYNAGTMIQNLDDLENYVHTLGHGSTPGVILLGLDHWWFNDDWPTQEGFEEGITSDSALTWQAHLFLMRKFRRNLQKLREVEPQRNRIGVAALRLNEGFLLDGSKLGQEAPHTAAGWAFKDREDPTIISRVRKGIGRFQNTTGISQPRVVQLRRILQQFKDKGVYVLAFAPPINAESVALMEKIPGQRTLWREFRATMPRLCKEFGFPYVDATTTKLLGADDRYMKDGIHAEQTFHVLLLREWLKQPAAEKQLPGTRERVNALIAAPRTNFWYPDYAVVTAKRPSALATSGQL